MNGDTYSELLDLATAYLLGQKSVSDCDEWLAGLDWDDLRSEPKARDMAGHMELLSTEVLEELRPEDDFFQALADLVERETGSRYIRSASDTAMLVGASATNEVIRQPEHVMATW